MAVPIVQIAEVAIVVTDLERSIKFYQEVLGLPLWDRAETHATLRMGNGFIGLWLPGAWELTPTDGRPPLRLQGGARQHFNFWIHNRDAAAAVENLRKHDVPFYGPRYNKKGEAHIDFEDPDGHMLEYWGREEFGPPPDKSEAYS